MEFKVREDGTKDYGYLAAVDPPYAVQLSCDDCNTTWAGCADESFCPECHQQVEFWQGNGLPIRHTEEK